MNHQLGLPVVDEAGGNAPGQVQALIGPAKQRGPAVGGDYPSGEISLDGPLEEAFGGWLAQRRRNTPRHPPISSFLGHKSLWINDLEGTSPPLHARL